MYKQTVRVGISNLAFSIGAAVALLLFLAVLSHFSLGAAEVPVELAAVALCGVSVAIHCARKKVCYVFCIVDTHFIIRKEEGTRHTVLLDCKLADIRAIAPAGELSAEYEQLPVSAHYASALSRRRNYCLVYAKRHSAAVHKILFSPSPRMLEGFEKMIPLVCQVPQSKLKKRAAT
ncbi:hypothetical protein [Feifania hominis]|uniref:Uncharacterized protein n=1 Tax=Feifania hominis TaxID=2763660 RepID=A0A926HQG9_9FIRM|nr:hypothetical protein [Feifania hominis]MBC8536327.1 hypothetical protein [Feifania hominis]